MKYRKLGSTDIKVSEIGYGTWGLGGNSYGPVDRMVAKKSLELAFERGINFYDTSDLYGNGISESLLGEIFKNKREKVVYATKGGLLPHTSFHMPMDFSRRHLEKALEGSLKRLKTDYIDVYQLHSPTIEVIDKDDSIIQTLKDFIKEGKIRDYGISVRSPDDGIIAIEKYEFPVLQVNFNMIDQRALDNGLFDMAKTRRTGIIIRTPLVFGYLTGKMNGEEQFKGFDHRANWPKKQLSRWAGAPDFFSWLWSSEGRTPVQSALSFCLCHEAVSCVIPGMLNEEEVLENTAVSQLIPLSTEEIEKVRKTYKANDFYDKSIKQRK